MRDTNQVRDRDMEGGHLELYIDDINFTDYQMETLMKIYLTTILYYIFMLFSSVF